MNKSLKAQNSFKWYEPGDEDWDWEADEKWREKQRRGFAPSPSLPAGTLDAPSSSLSNEDDSSAGSESDDSGSDDSESGYSHSSGGSDSERSSETGSSERKTRKP